MYVECNSNPLFKSILQILHETQANIQALQKAVAGLREQVSDVIAGQAEIKRRIWEMQYLQRERA